MEFYLEDLIKLLAAILAGGVIGAEREFRDKAAGFRTIIFICVGATLFTIFSQRMGADSSPTRIAANIVTGIGFLGAGAILRDGVKVAGLTTAATIWLAAALGMGIGSGAYILTGIATFAILIILWIFPLLEHRIDNIRDTRIYAITTNGNDPDLDAIASLLKDCSLRVTSRKQTRSGEMVKSQWQVHGSLKAHEKLVDMLLSDPKVLDFNY